MHDPDRYIPALGYDLLTPLYDPLLGWLMRETSPRDLKIAGWLMNSPTQTTLLTAFYRVWFFHHLSTHNKRRTLGEVLRVLRPGGRLHIVDFGAPRALYARLTALIMARSEGGSVNVKGLLPEMFREAGLERVEGTGQFVTVAGALSFYQARKLLKVRLEDSC